MGKLYVKRDANAGRVYRQAEKIPSARQRLLQTVLVGTLHSGLR